MSRLFRKFNYFKKLCAFAVKNSRLIGRFDFFFQQLTLIKVCVFSV